MRLTRPQTIDLGRMRVSQPIPWARRLANVMATRKRHSPERMVRNVKTADRLLDELNNTAAVCRGVGCE